MLSTPEGQRQMDLVQILVATRLAHAEAGVTQSATELPGAFLDAIRIAHSENAAETEAFDRASAATALMR